MKRASEKDLQQILQEKYLLAQSEIPEPPLESLLTGRCRVRDFLRRWESQLRPLAPEPLRAYKNNVICLIDALCRESAALGLEPAVSRAMCDYYTCALENQSTSIAVTKLTRVMLEHYMAKIAQIPTVAYSLTVTRTIRLIDQQLYAPCTPGGLAETLKLHPAYLSALFRKEVGVTLGSYIRRRKLEEARMLLHNESCNVAEIASRLCFCSSSYFCKSFREVYGAPPRAYLQKNLR